MSSNNYDILTYSRYAVNINETMVIIIVGFCNVSTGLSLSHIRGLNYYNKLIQLQDDVGQD